MTEVARQSLGNKLSHAWNAFRRAPTPELDTVQYQNLGVSYSRRPDAHRYSMATDKSITASIYTRISLDVASVQMRHIRLDEERRYSEDIMSKLNQCLLIEPNLDQTPRSFWQDAVLSMFSEGMTVIVPVETDRDPSNNTFDISNMRVGKVISWYPQHVRVDVYNEWDGQHHEVTLAKRSVAIVENPFYELMNEPNSTLTRLKRKLALLDAVDEQTGSGKLDLIVQIPYSLKRESQQNFAEKRRKDIEDQLRGSKYGIAYMDGTEQITQLNRPAENNLLKQVEMLTDQLYAQLGLTPSIFDGTADEAAMLNYHNRTIEPILEAFASAMRKSFLSKTARSQGQDIQYFRDPFKLIPIEQLAEISDKFTRNEIASSNEIRTSIGWKPSKDPKADELRNANLSAPKEALEEVQAEKAVDAITKKEGDLQNEI